MNLTPNQWAILVKLTTADPDFTLGGIATGAL